MNREVDPKEVGRRLRELRGTKRQSEVADAIGVSKMAISQYESGQRIPQDRIKVRLANYYHACVDSIFYA